MSRLEKISRHRQQQGRLSLSLSLSLLSLLRFVVCSIYQVEYILTNETRDKLEFSIQELLPTAHRS